MSLLKVIENRCDFGNYYGYPKCCIKEFNNRYNKKPPNKLQYKVAKHQGFIPCIVCCKLIKHNEIKIENLIQNRECELSYPNDEGVRSEYTLLCRDISRQHKLLKKIKKHVEFTNDLDYNSVLYKLIVNKIIRRKRMKRKKIKNT